MLMNIGTKTINTERLILREFKYSDDEDMLRYWISDSKIQICHKENNRPSKRVIKKCGFEYEGTLRDFFYIDGEYVDRLYYSLIKGKELNNNYRV